MNIPLYCPNPNDPVNENLLKVIPDYPWVEWSKSPGTGLFLIVENGVLGLASSGWPKVHPVVVDFMSGAASYRRNHGGGTGQMVAKAVGLKKRRDLLIWDGTAGLGRDAFVLASLGARVHMFERQPVVQALLRDGLYRLSLSADDELHRIYQRMTLTEDSMTAESSAEGERPDVIYLDPMFPERSKKAKVKKDMSLFHELVGTDDDADALLPAALDLAEYRVVVKRPKGAPVLNGQKPSFTVDGKSSRFDVYTKQAIPEE